MQGMRMNMCQHYLQQSTKGLMMETSNPTRQMKQQCCRGMGEVSENCRWNMMMQKGESEGQCVPQDNYLLCLT